MLSVEDVDGYLAAVEAVRGTGARPGSMDEAVALLGLEQAASRGASPLQRAITEKVRTAIFVEKGRQQSELLQLCGVLLRLDRLMPISQNFFEPASRILGMLPAGQAIKDFSESVAWHTAIQTILCCAVVPGDHYSDEVALIHHQRDVAFCDAVSRLRQKGYRFDLVDHTVKFCDGELQRACRELKGLVAAYHGPELIHFLLRWLYDSKQFQYGVYLIGRSNRGPGSTATPSVPLGYLLNLAFAHCGEETPRSDTAETFGEIVHLAADIVATIDVEQHSRIAHASRSSHDRLPNYIREVILEDHLLTFRQIPAITAVELIPGLFDWTSSMDLRSKLGWTIDEAMRIAKAVLEAVPPGVTNALFRRDQFLSLGLSPSALDAFLDQFSHDPAVLNRDYLTPMDADKADVMFKPFIRLNPTKFLLVSPSLNAVGFYEATAAALRRAYPNEQIEKQIGNRIEPTVESIFKARGITPSMVSRKYSMEVDGECDLVIETEKTIILIELKKKSVTRAAQAGDDVKALVDLYGGVIDTQSQLGQHEVLLYKHGYIEFLDKSRLERRGRNCERLAVTLFDWGGIQDRSVQLKIAPILIGSEITSVKPQDADVRKKLRNANETSRKLAAQYRELLQLGHDRRTIFMNWWFLSVPQLMFLLSNATDAGAFLTRLRMTKHASTGSLDFYKEYDNLDRMWTEAEQAES